MIKYILPLTILIFSMSSCGSDESESKELEEAKVTHGEEAKNNSKTQ